MSRQAGMVRVLSNARRPFAEEGKADGIQQAHELDGACQALE